MPSRLVRDVMKIGVPTCSRETRLPEVARLMANENADALVVLDEFGACGVISQSDLVQAFTRNYELLSAEDLMMEQIISISPESSLAAAANMMDHENVHQLFVMHEHPGPSRPSAVVTMRALVREMAGLPPEKIEMPVFKPVKDTQAGTRE